MMNSENLEKILNLSETELLNAAWLWYSVDGSDRLFSTHLTNRCSSPTYFVVTERNLAILVSALEADIDFGVDKKVYSDGDDANRKLTDVFRRAGFPRNIYLNYSSSADPKVDGLGHGTHSKITKQVTKVYVDAGQRSPKFRSAESLFYSLVERRTPLQIERMKLAAVRADWILRESFSLIREGLSEHEIADEIRDKTESTSQAFCRDNGVENETYSWEKEACPIVLVGPNLAKGGHAETSDYRIKSGETVYADFGVKLDFTDGGSVSSDLQRMGYLPRVGETSAPGDVAKVFHTLSTAIEAGMRAIRPGLHGYEIDNVVRKFILEAGYPDYPHSTGHPIGEVAHSPGTLLGVQSNPRSRKLIQENGTYTIEPRCQIPNGGSIEEMVLVTKDGGQPLCKPQTELWLIGQNI